MDRFEDMRCFVHVSELQSVTKAAEKLNLAPSAVSRRLKELESRLDAQLLTRTTRRMSLTEAGQVFYRRARQLLNDLDDAEAEVSDQSHALKGLLRVTAPLTFGVCYLSGIVTDFLDQHPELTLDLDLSDREVDLVGEGIDLAIRIGVLQDSSLIARKIADVKMVVVASPEFLRRFGMPSHPDDLKLLPGICYTNAERPGIWRYRDGDGTDASVQVPMRMKANNGTVLADAAAAGLGVAIEPSFIVHQYLASGALVPVLRDYQWPDVAIYAVYPETRHLSAKARAFIDFVHGRIGSRPVWDDLLGEEE